MARDLHRRSVLSLLAALPIVAGGGARAFAATAAPRVFKVAATPSRQVEVTHWEAVGKRKGIIAFSPGFGSSPRFYPDFVQAWAGAGYDIFAPLHTDSREYPDPKAFAGAGAWPTRIEDMRAIAGLFEGPYVAAGHSFGALTALVLGGADAVIPPGIRGPLFDPRTRAVVAFSPPPPIPALITDAGYAKLARPALIQTGTRDVLPSGTPDPQGWRGHFAAFARSPMSGEHHGLILDGVDHYFGGRICDYSKSGPDQRAQLRLATDASLAFLARYGPEDRSPASRVDPAFPIDPAARYYRR